MRSGIGGPPQPGQALACGLIGRWQCTQGDKDMAGSGVGTWTAVEPGGIAAAETACGPVWVVRGPIREVRL